MTTLNDYGIWVDRAYGGAERGTISQPFNTVGEGVSSVPPASAGVVVHVQTANYPEAVTIARNMVIKAEGGPVVVGQ